MAKTTFITSHRMRVKKANETIKNLPERISVFDREAYVEFFLLEDIVRLYDYRLKNERAKKVETRAGQLAKDRNIEKFTAIIRIFKSAIEVAWGEITSGNYKAVWKAIREGALMSAAGSLKNLPVLRDMAVELLKELSEEALKATGESGALEESLDDMEAHEANVRKVRGLPSVEEINAVIREVEAAIPDEQPKSKLKPNI